MCGQVTPGGVWRPCRARKEEAIYTCSTRSLQVTFYWRAAWSRLSTQMFHNSQCWIPQLHTAMMWVKRICMWVSDQKAEAFSWPSAERRCAWLSLDYIPVGAEWGNYCCWVLSRIRGGESSSIPLKSEEDPACLPSTHHTWLLSPSSMSLPPQRLAWPPSHTWVLQSLNFIGTSYRLYIVRVKVT